MFANIFALVTIAGMASASQHMPRHNLAKRCDAVQVQFHFNDTTLGSMLSCTADVTNRGSSTPLLARTYCVDGPSVNYTVVSGDTLEKIAAEFNSGVCNIAAVNGLENPDFLALGQVLVVPTDVCNPDNDSCRTPLGTATCVDPSSGVSPIYVIQAGDTFFLIASDLGITLDSLVAANPGVDAGNLQIGQEINVPICASETVSPIANPTASSAPERRF